MNFSRRLTNERESLSGRPKISCAGERLQSGSGVFLDCNKALRSLSLSSVPFGPMFDLSSILLILPQPLHGHLIVENALMKCGALHPP